MYSEPKNITFPSQVRFAPGAVGQLPGIIAGYDAKKLFIVTDQGIVKAGILDKVISVLKEAKIPYSVYDRVIPNPPDYQVEEALRQFKEDRCDILLGLGGGSAMDVAKSVLVMAAHPGSILDYDCIYGGAEKIKGNVPKIICIPTTAGSGCEVSAGSVITDTKRNVKVVIISPFMTPDIALVDPEIQLELPKFITSTTGMDALCHCIEVYVSKNHESFTEHMMLYGIQLITDNILKAYENGKDLEARSAMAFAALVGGMGINVKGLGVCHSLSHQLSSECDISHGMANAVLLPYTMEFNLEYAAEKYARVAQSMGLDIAGKSVPEAGKMAVEKVKTICGALGIPEKLSQLGVKEDALEKMASQAVNDVCHSGNPGTCGRQDMLDLYRKAY